MFKPKNYGAIFDQRGANYHQAILDFPHARDQEFDMLLKYAAITPADCVADYPAGGAYLYRYLRQLGVAKVNYFPLETSAYFYGLNEYDNAELHDEDNPALGRERFDCLISLAGLHHVVDRARYYQAFFTVLKPGGRIVIADVMSGSEVGEFLNGFVDRHSELGHEGRFLTIEDQHALSAAGFATVSARLENYEWCFDRPQDRANYCRLMFGIAADVDQIEACLTAQFHPVGTNLPWQLYVITAVKPPR